MTSNIKDNYNRGLSGNTPNVESTSNRFPPVCDDRIPSILQKAFSNRFPDTNTNENDSRKHINNKPVFSESEEIDQNDSYKAIPLTQSAKHKDVALILKWIESGADVDKANKDGLTPIFLAALNGHLKIVVKLIEAGADVNKPNKGGFTPLYVAAQKGHLNIVDKLIEAGADVNAANKDGVSPLIVATQNGHLNIVDKLIKEGAEINKADKDGLTAIFLASLNGHVDTLVKLIKAGADVNAANKDGFTPLFLALKDVHVNIMVKLIKAGADVNAANKDGISPLFLAAFKGNITIVKKLIQNGAKVNQTNINGFTPLFMSLLNNNIKVANKLIGEDAFIDMNDIKLMQYFTNINGKEKSSITKFNMVKVKKILNLGYSKGEVVQIVKHNLFDDILNYSIVQWGSFDIEKLTAAINYLKSENPSYQDLQLFLAFGKKFSLDRCKEKHCFELVDNWDHFVVRKKNFRRLRGYKINQKKYGSLMYQSILMTAEFIKSQLTFHQLLAILGRVRYDMELFLSDKPEMNQKFGKPRGKTYITHLDNLYVDVNTRLNQLFVEKKAPSLQNENTQFIQTFGTLGSRTLPLSYFGPKVKTLFHTRPQYIRPILDHVDHLYQEALAIDDYEKLTEKLGEIFWWICKAKPWKRGDPSIAEILIKAIYLHKGFKPHAWAENRVPWVEVEIQPEVDKFAKNFHSLLN